MVDSLNVFQGLGTGPKKEVFSVCLLMLICLFRWPTPTGVHRMEQKGILSLLIDSNTVPHQSSHKETVFVLECCTVRSLCKSE